MSNRSIKETPIWINGQPDGCLPANDRGLAYGDGVFETVRVSSAGPVLVDLHLGRLRRGLRALAIDVDWDKLRSEILAYPGWSNDGVVKLIVTRGGGGRGYASQPLVGPNRVFSKHPVPDYDPEWSRVGIKVFDCKTRLARNHQLSGIKHLNRLEQVLARQEWQGNTFQEGLLLDQQGSVVEGVFSNLFFVRDLTIFTPALDACGVAGVMREWLLLQFQKQGYNVVVQQFTLQDIQLADEWFFCNSVYGIWPVRQFENRVWSVGVVTRKAQQWVADHWQL